MTEQLQMLEVTTSPIIILLLLLIIIIIINLEGKKTVKNQKDTQMTLVRLELPRAT